MIEESPLVRLRSPVVRQDQVQPFTDQQIDQLLEVSRRTRHPKRDEAMLLFLLDTGVRASELCGLKLGDLNFTGRSASVLGKGNKRRQVYYGVRTSRAVWAYLREKDRSESSIPLFAADAGHTPGEALTRSGLLQFLERLEKAARLEGVRCSPHTCRHTFAISYLRNGGDVFTLKELLGHTTLAMVNRYLAIAQADLAAAHRRCSPMDRRKGREKER